MTTSKPADTIVATMPIAKGAYTMKGPDEVLTMKTLYGKGHSACRIAAILGCNHHTMLRYVRNGFDAARREQQPSALDAYTDFLLERFLRHDGNNDVVHQELVADLGIDGFLWTVQRAFKPHRQQLWVARLLTPFETAPGEQVQIDFEVRTVPIKGREHAFHLFVATLGYSRRIIAKAYSAETQGAWLDCTEAALALWRRAKDGLDGQRENAGDHAAAWRRASDLARPAAGSCPLLGSKAPCLSVVRCSRRATTGYVRQGRTQCRLHQGECLSGSAVRELRRVGSRSTSA